MENPFAPIVERLDKIESILNYLHSKELLTGQAPNSSNDELISRKDAAQLLGISLPTLHSYTKDGRIPAYRIGSQVRFKKSEVLDCLTKVQTKKKF